MYRYAQLNLDHQVIALTEHDQPLIADHCILVDEFPQMLSQYDETSGLFTPTPPSIPEPTPLTQLAFLRRFTAPERIAIRASTDPIIVDFMHLVNLAQDILVTDSDTRMGVNYLAQQCLIAPERVSEILA